MARAATGWSYASFQSNWVKGDPDFHIAALEDLCHHLETVELLTLSEKDMSDLLKKIATDGFSELERLPGDAQCRAQRDFLLDGLLRATTMLVGRIPIPAFERWFPQFLDRPFQEGCDLGSSFVSIFKEIIGHSSTFSPPQQISLKRVMFPIFVTQLNRGVDRPDFIRYALELLTTLTKDLGYQLDAAERQQLCRQIGAFASDPAKGEFATEVGNLAVAWSDADVTDESFDGLVTNLLANVAEVPMAFTVLTMLVRHNAAKFAGHIQPLIDLFYGRALEVDVREEDGREINYDAVVTSQASILCLEALISAFPATFEETADSYVDLVLALYDVGNSLPPSTTSSGESPGDSSDSGLADKGGADFVFEDGDPPSDDDVINNSDETWKVRQACHTLAQTLIHKYPTVFFDKFIVANDQASQFLIRDSDRGAKKTGLQTLLLIARTFKGQLSQKLVLKWTSRLTTELLDEDMELVGLVLPVLSRLLSEFGWIEQKYIQRAIKNMASRQLLPKQMPDILALLSALISVGKVFTVGDPSLVQLAETLSRILIADSAAGLGAPPRAQCLAVVSLLYDRVRKPSATVTKSLISLNQKVIAIADRTNEFQSPAVATLGVFITIFGNTQTADASLHAIVKALASESCVKQAANALALIGSSPAKKLLVSVSGDIVARLEKYLGRPDNALVYSALWPLKIGLANQGFLKPEQCRSIIGPLSIIFEHNDFRCKLLAIEVAQGIAARAFLSAAVAETILPKVQQLAGKSVPPEVINAIGRFLIAGKWDAKQLVSRFLQAGDALEASGSHALEDLTISRNLAALVALLASSSPASASSLLASLEKRIVQEKKLSTFALRCVGELGARVSVSDSAALVNAIFELVESQDRALFTAAAESAGLIAVGSLDALYGRLVAKVTSDSEREVAWLIAVGAFLKALPKPNASLDLGALVRHLIKSADYEKETADSLVKCLSAVLLIQPQFFRVLIDSVRAHNNASPISARALATWLEGADEAEAAPVVDALLSEVQPGHFPTTAGVITAAKIALRFGGLRQKVFQKSSSIIDCLRISPEQFVDVWAGPERRTVDIGRGMRSNALDTLQAIFDSSPESLDIERVVQQLISNLRDQREKSDVLKSAIRFLGKMCEDDYAAPSVVKLVLTILPAIEAIDGKLSPDETGDPELLEPYLAFMARFHSLLKDSPNVQFERIYARCRLYPSLGRIETDASFSMEYRRVGIQESQKVSVGFQLMKDLNPNAAIIFAAD